MASTRISWPYKKTLLIGASSGIGAALAARVTFSNPNAHVIAVARREDRLKQLQAANGGAERITTVGFDVGNTQEIEGFVKRYVQYLIDYTSLLWLC
jgi:NADP-dependent 3-hydroxy acid dehydrogenase YdfG